MSDTETKPGPWNIEKLARQQQSHNWCFRTFLKFNCKEPDNEIDNLVTQIANDIWADFDCATCARCCKVLRPAFSYEEQQRVAQRLGLSIGDFRDKYLILNHYDERSLWKTRKTPCPFLENNKCSVYEDRPAECHNYPYLYESGFRSRLWAMIDRAFTCPVVFGVLEILKKRLWLPQATIINKSGNHDKRKYNKFRAKAMDPR
jgi:Fe-S-cluster containining protein